MKLRLLLHKLGVILDLVWRSILALQELKVGLSYVLHKELTGNFYACLGAKYICMTTSASDRLILVGSETFKPKNEDFA